MVKHDFLILHQIHIAPWDMNNRLVQRCDKTYTVYIYRNYVISLKKLFQLNFLCESTLNKVDLAKILNNPAFLQFGIFLKASLTCYVFACNWTLFAS